jgi:putative transposase
MEQRQGDRSSGLMVVKGVPEHIRSDNGPEFVAKDLRKWLADTGAKTLYIEPGSPWENGYCESFNSKLRDEFLNGEIFYSLKEVQVLAERWRVHYNTVRPHSSLGYRPRAPQAWLALNSGSAELETATRFPALHSPNGLSWSLASCPKPSRVAVTESSHTREMFLRHGIGKTGTTWSTHLRIIA